MQVLQPLMAVRLTEVIGPDGRLSIRARVTLDDSSDPCETIAASILQAYISQPAINRQLPLVIKLWGKAGGHPSDIICNSEDKSFIIATLVTLAKLTFRYGYTN